MPRRQSTEGGSLAKRSPQTIQKREREQAKREKRERKLEKKAAAAEEKAAQNAQPDPETVDPPE
jgi:hypothetical protein